MIPGVVVTEDQATLNGRTRVSIGRLEPSSGLRQDIIIDSKTGELIGERSVIVDPKEGSPFPAGTSEGGPPSPRRSSTRRPPAETYTAIWVSPARADIMTGTPTSHKRDVATARSDVDPARIELPPTYSIDITSVFELNFERR